MDLESASEPGEPRVPDLYPVITGVQVLSHGLLALTFADGSRGNVDLSHLIRKPEGVFVPFTDPEFFAQVRVDSESGTVVWPNGVDLDPDVLYERAHGLNTLNVESDSDPAA